jgi:hypothetical protein
VHPAPISATRLDGGLQLNLPPHSVSVVALQSAQ